LLLRLQGFELEDNLTSDNLFALFQLLLLLKFLLFDFLFGLDFVLVLKDIVEHRLRPRLH
jgi:hypothetical protein